MSQQWIFSLKTILRRLSSLPQGFMKLNQDEIVLKSHIDRKLVSIGDYTYGSPQVHSWDDSTKLTIGKFCSIAEGVTFLLGGEHRLDWVTTFPFNVFHEAWPSAKDFKGHPQTKGDILVGNDVWIGKDSMILSGVQIGDGAVIAAGSLITSEVQPYSIVGGNPAKLIRKRFSDEDIEKLLQLKWWNWPHEKIERNIGNLLSSPSRILNQESTD